VPNFGHNSIHSSPTRKAPLKLLCLLLDTTMYIRWKTRENQQGTTAYCYLCSGERVAGKVKSSTLAYLGSIAAKPEASQRAVFWETVISLALAPDGRSCPLDASSASSSLTLNSQSNLANSNCHWSICCCRVTTCSPEAFRPSNRPRPASSSCA